MKFVSFIRKNLDPERGRFTVQRGANTEKKFRNFFLKKNRHIRHGRTSAPSFRKKKIFLFLFIFFP